jgi:dipeptidyl aminopeptidase/acylaminoacyl peptidase
MRKAIHLVFLLFICGVGSLTAENSAKRFLSIDDFPKLQDVSDLHCSADGQWIAYTVSDSELQADKRHTAIWMASWDGKQDLRVTYGSSSDTSPRFSPDGKYVSFLSSRPADSKSQVWIIDRRGGEARQLTNVKEDIESYEWSPDSKKLVLIMSESEDEKAPPKPIVIDRYHFKSDIYGYLTEASHTHLYLFDVATQKMDPLTTDKRFNDNAPAWSPDGKRIAYVTNHSDDPDQTGTNDIFLIDTRQGAKPVKLLTANRPNYQQLIWSPDDKTIAYLVGAGAKYDAYSQDKLAVVAVANGESRVLTDKLDLMVSAPQFSVDGSFLTFLVYGDRVEYPAKVSVSGGDVQPILNGSMGVSEQCRGGDHTAVLVSTDSSAPEIHALEGTKLRKLTTHNDQLLSQLQLGAVEDISFHSKDGTEVHGMVVKPPNFKSGKKYPTILWIHGGPNYQDDHSLPVNLYALQLERQLLAANGYLAVAINYRGSTGRGFDFCRSIYADWGHKEVVDLLGGIDEVVRQGIADPDRLGLGGWSYGGILTDATIATDVRFKAAISGAGSANQLSMYGSDQYALQYNNEIGGPWNALETWLKVSFPFFHADRIHTPTLFMGGEKDFNVPITGGEQMYQALRTLGIPTELVVYPGQFHIFTRPSFIRDRAQRWLAWFDKYLKPQR